MVDLILVLQGKLKMEFERTDIASRVLEPGDMIVFTVRHTLPCLSVAEGDGGGHGIPGGVSGEKK